jgi:hypothetical protein
MVICTSIGPYRVCTTWPVKVPFFPELPPAEAPEFELLPELLFEPLELLELLALLDEPELEFELLDEPVFVEPGVAVAFPWVLLLRTPVPMNTPPAMTPMVARPLTKADDGRMSWSPTRRISRSEFGVRERRRVQDR